MMMTSRELIRALKGRRIVDVKLNRFRTCLNLKSRQNEWTCNPEFYLDDGSSLHFVVCETETGEYGIEPVLMPPLGFLKREQAQ